MSNPTESPDVAQIEINGVNICVEDHGSSESAILFLHFSGANLRMWDRMIPLMHERHRCIALDLRAHGRSSAPGAGYHPADFAADILGVLDALEIEKTHVVGSSLGAEVGLSLAASNADRVLSLVADGALCSEYGAYGTRAASSLDEDESMLERLQVIRDCAETSYGSTDDLVDATRAMYEGSLYWSDCLETVTAYGTVQASEGSFVTAWRKWARDEYMEHYFRLQVEEHWPHVRCPILMLPDEEFRTDEKAFAIVNRLAELPTTCEIRVVPGSDHPFSWMQIPEAMAEAVLGFLGQVDG